MTFVLEAHAQANEPPKRKGSVADFLTQAQAMGVQAQGAVASVRVSE